MLFCFAGIAQGQNQSQENALDIRQRHIVAISSFTAKGDLEQLSRALNEGLDAGLTVNEAKEVLVHLYAYCGFPRSLQGINTLIAVLEARKAKGMTDKVGREATPITSTESKYERGRKVLETLTGKPEKGPKTGYAAFSPEIEVFLKEHLFADIFERDVLTYRERELVTISALASMWGVEPMLRSHLTICLNVGLTPDQLRQFIGIIKSIAGEKEAGSAQRVLDDVLKSKQSQQAR